MFSSLTSYLFGNSSGDTINPSTEGAANQSNQSDQSNASDNIKLKVTTETEGDEDWLIVDKDEEESLPQTDSEEEIPFVEIRRQRPGSSRHQRVGSGGALSINSDGYPSLAQGISQYGISMASCMGESWFLTPPPCFTSTGPIDMVTSPFENLLIEHPSMSVYHRIRSAAPQPDGSMIDYELSFGPERSRVQVQLNTREERTPVRPARAVAVAVVPRRVERIENLTQQQTKEVAFSRNAQKVHEKKARQVLCRGAIKRGNKVRDFNSKGGRPRRSDMQHCKILSGANNNRKC